MNKNIFFILIVAISVGFLISWNVFMKKQSYKSTVIILNGPSGSGKSSIQKEFQKIMMPNLWLKTGIDTLFDAPMPDITPENMNYWQSQNLIRWVETSQDKNGNTVITLKIGEQGDKVAYAMNSAIAAYAQNGCNIIVDYIAYKKEWFDDLQNKLKHFNTFYVSVEISLETLEKREEVRGTSPKGHARSHYYTVYGDKRYDLVVNSEKNSAKVIAEQIKQLIEK